jgi:two-component system chemotaxis response regulator CheY
MLPFCIVTRRAAEGWMMRFLVVDDDFSSRELIKAIVTPYGSCDLALDGSEALSRFLRALEDDQPYDFIFLDVVMPGLSGLETLDAIRNIESSYNIHGPRRVKILIITGYYDPKLSIRTFQKDCESYLSKPFMPRHILDKVQTMLGELPPLRTSEKTTAPASGTAGSS